MARCFVLSWRAVLCCSVVPPVVRCAAVCLVPAGWCCVSLPVVARCSLLGLVALCCFPVACFVAAAPAWPLGVLPCCVLWFVVVPRSPVLSSVSCGAVLPCNDAVRFALLVVLVCFLSLFVQCCVALCCRACVVLFVAGLVCVVAGAWCSGVSLCAVLSSLALCGAVVLTCCVVWCVLVSFCALLCSVVLCCVVVPCCCAVLCVSLCSGLLLSFHP